MVLPITVPFAAWTAVALIPLITLAYKKNAPLKAVLKTLCALFFLCAALQSIAHAIVTTTSNPALLPPFYALVPSQAGAALATAASGSPAAHDSGATAARAWILALASPSDLVSFEYFVPSAPSAPTATAAAAAARVDKAAAAEAVAALSADGVADVLATAAAGLAHANADSAATVSASAASHRAAASADPTQSVPLLAAAGHFRISAASDAARLLSRSPAVLFPPSSLLQLLSVMFAHAPLHHLIILLGLCFSFIGDVLLLGASAPMFLAGLGAFLIAHVAFSAAHLSRLAALPTALFTPAGAPVPGLLPLVAVLLATFSLMIFWLFFAGSLSKQKPVIVKAVVVYMVVIVGMVFLACSLVLFTPAADTLRPAVGSVVEGHFVVFDLTPDADAVADGTAAVSGHHDTLTVSSVETTGTDATTGAPVVERTSVATLRTHPHADAATASALRSATVASATEEMTVIKTTRAPAEPASRDTLAEAHSAASERRRLHGSSNGHEAAAALGSANASAGLGAATASLGTGAAAGSPKARLHGAGAGSGAQSWVSIASLWRSLPALSRQAALTVAAAVLFMISDIFVAREAFVSRSKMNQAVGLPLYFGAQLMLAAALKEI